MAGKNKRAAAALDPKPQLQMTRIFDAPRYLVFRMWSEPEHMRNWCAPKGFTVPVCDGEFRVGGAWHSTMRAPDGKQHRLRGVYREIVANARLVFTHAWIGDDGKPGHETLVTVTFADHGNKTRMTFHQGAFDTVAARDGHEGGWMQCFEKLETYLGGVETEDAKAPVQSLGTGNLEDRQIVISRIFDAPRELVWEAWTDPEQVVKWWGPNGFTTTIEKMEVRPGGVWKHVMHGPDGAEYPNKSVFIEVVKPERIVYAHGGARKGEKGVRFRSTWTFEAIGGKTRLTISMVFETAPDRDRVVKDYGAIEGGKQTLARLAEHLQTNAL